MKMKFALAVIPFLAANVIAEPASEKTNSLGNLKQTVKVCLNVSGNVAKSGFTARFKSHDFFNHFGWSTHEVVNGEECVSHTYSHGPKRIKVFLSGVDGNWPTYVKVSPDASCNFLNRHGRFSQSFESDYQRVYAANEVWTFNITQSAPENGYRYVYNLSCGRLSS